MKSLPYLLLLSLILTIGCHQEKESISSEELARALNLTRINLQTRKTPLQPNEPVFFIKETSEGRMDWFSAFSAPGANGTVILITNSKEGSIHFLVDDDSGKTTSPVNLKTYEMHAYSTQIGHIELQDFFLCYSDSGYGKQVAKGVNFGDDRMNAKWVSYRLIPASIVPEDAPAYIHQSIKKWRQIQSGDGQ
jgi:hypothetical protein